MCQLLILLLCSVVTLHSSEYSVAGKKNTFPEVIGPYCFNRKLAPNGHGQCALYVHKDREHATLTYTDFGDGHTVKKYEGHGGEFPHGTSYVFRGDDLQRSTDPATGQRRAVVIMGGSWPPSGPWQRACARRKQAERDLLESWQGKSESAPQVE